MENKDLYELLIKYKAGDKNGFHIFYEELKKPVFYNIYSILKNKDVSEDILQETFIKLLENIDKINKEESILGYLMVISKNIALDYLKKNKNLRIDDDEINDEERTLASNNQNEAKDSTNYHQLLFLIKDLLKPKEFEIFTLRLIDDLSYKEISEILKIPIGTLTYTYNEILKKLETKLERRT